ncbi:hypothetical protein BGZ74_002585 [Mortierella antarctica]|nr:hypothetical protein BGZ74_002585 [Mortierella antarctica]
MPRKLPVSLWPVRCSDRIRERAELIAIKAEEEAEALKVAALIKAEEEAEALNAAALIKPEPIDETSFDSGLHADGAKLEPTDQLSQGSQAKSGRRSVRTRQERVKHRAHGVANFPRGVSQADRILRQRSSEVKRAIAEAVARSHYLGAKKAATVAAAKAALKCHREATRARSRSRAPAAENRDWAMSRDANTSSSSLNRDRTDPTQGFLGPDNGELLVATGMLYYSPQDPQWIRALLRGWLYTFFESKDPSLNPLAAVIHGMPRPGEIIHGITFPACLSQPQLYNTDGRGPWGGIRRLWCIPVVDRYTKNISAIVRTDQVACWLRIRVSELLGFLVLAHPLEWMQLQQYLAFRLQMTFILKEVPELRTCFESAVDLEAGVSNNLQQLSARVRLIARNFITMDHEHRKLMTQNLYKLVAHRRRGQRNMLEAHQLSRNLFPWPLVQGYQSPQGFQPPCQFPSFPLPFFTSPPSLSTSPSSRSSSACPSPPSFDPEAPPTAKWWCLSPPFDLIEFQCQVDFLGQIHDRFFERNAQNFALLRGSFGVWDPEVGTNPTVYLDKARILDGVMLQHDQQHYAIAQQSVVRSSLWPACFRKAVVRPADSSLAGVPRPYAGGSDGELDEHVLQARQRDAVDNPAPRST